MAKTTVKDTVLVLDDEMHHMTWLLDYLYSKTLNVLPVDNANSAIEEMEKEVYRAAVIDLNVPMLSPMKEVARELGSPYASYPGLYVARRARNCGYRARQVVIYSVHRDPSVVEEVEKLDCVYIMKGRPGEIKRELDAILAFDPTE